jgi:hypothetical protein
MRSYIVNDSNRKMLEDIHNRLDDYSLVELEAWKKHLGENLQVGDAEVRKEVHDMLTKEIYRRRHDHS